MITRAVVIVGLFILGSGAVASPAGAQQPGTRFPVPHHQQITANPFGLILGWYNAEYERKLSETWSIGLGGSRLPLDDEGVTSASAAFRFYPQSASLTSFYFGPRLGFYRVHEIDDSESWLGVGFELGYTWLLGKNRNFNVSLGAGATKLLAGPVVPTVKLLNVGWAF